MQHKPSRVSYTVGVTHCILTFMTKDHKMDHFQLYKKGREERFRNFGTQRLRKRADLQSRCVLVRPPGIF